jgi:transposase
MEKEEGVFVGIDVCKSWLDVFDGKQCYRVSNSKKGLKKLVFRLHKVKACLVVVESTGGYERLALQALWENKIPVALVNPRQTKRFAQGLAVEAKTDVIDAKMLQRFAQMVRPRALPPPSAQMLKLQGVLDRRRQLIETIIAEKNRAKAPLVDTFQKRSILRVLKVLKKELALISAEAQKLIEANETLRAKRDLLLSEHGVGEVLALTLLADVEELGTLNRAKVTSLIGLAPLDRQSGTKDGRRFIRGGRKHVRHVLYMATVAAIRRSPTLKPYFLRLVKRGKPKMVAIIACMRRLLITLNAKMRVFLEAQTLKAA